MPKGFSNGNTERTPQPPEVDVARQTESVLAGWPITGRRQVVTERFIARSPVGNDANERVLAWFSDAAFRRSFPSYKTPKTVTELHERLRCEFAEIRRTLIITDDNGPIGLIWIDLAGPRFVTTHHFIGERRWWGKGVIHEVRAAVINALFRAGTHKIIGKPSADNNAVVQTYRDQGFVVEGRLREERATTDGGRGDALYFGLLAHEWDYQRARQLPAIVQRRLERNKRKRAAPTTQRIVIDPVFEDPDSQCAVVAAHAHQVERETIMLFIDGIATATLNGGVVRIQLSQVGSDGQQKAAGELAIPASKFAAVLQGLQHIGQQLNEQHESVRNKGDAEKDE